MAAKAPERVAGTAKARLDFIGNKDTAVGMHHIDRFFQEAARIGQHPVRGEDRVRQETGKFNAVRRHIINLLLNLVSEPVAQVRCIHTIRIRWHHQPRGGCQRLSTAKRRRSAGGQLTGTVIGLFTDDNSGTAAESARHADRQVIGFRPGAHVHRAIDRRRRSRQQRFAVVEDIFMQVTGVGVQHFHLLRHRLNHGRMTMADACHVVIDVEIFIACRVPQILPFTPHQMNRFAIEQTIGFAKHFAAFIGQFARLAVERIGMFGAETVGIHNGGTRDHNDSRNKDEGGRADPCIMPA